MTTTTTPKTTAPKTKIPKPSKGRVVLFTCADGLELEEYSAVITDTEGYSKPGMVDLIVFDDGNRATRFETARSHSLVPKHNTWRYPPRVEGEIEVEE